MQKTKQRTSRLPEKNNLPINKAYVRPGDFRTSSQLPGLSMPLLRVLLLFSGGQSQRIKKSINTYSEFLKLHVNLVNHVRKKMVLSQSFIN